MISKLKKYLLRRIYGGSYKNGHYYSPVPNKEEALKYHHLFMSDIDEKTDIDLNTRIQHKNLKLYKDFINDFISIHKRYIPDNGFFTLSDAFFLSAIIRTNKPKRIIEIGSGFSSGLMLDVNEKVFNNTIEITMIEPFPERLYSVISKNDTKNNSVHLIKNYVQDVELTLFKSLDKNDILFIDSSHISKVGSDLNYIMFKILPLLNKGVYIHFHDITYPFEYPKEWIENGIYWNEIYLLRAFLMNNTNYSIEVFVNYLFNKNQEWFQEFIPDFNKEGGSLWLLKK